MNFPKDINNLIAEYLSYIDVYHLSCSCKSNYADYQPLIYSRIDWQFISIRGRYNKAFVLANLTKFDWKYLIPILPKDFVEKTLPRSFLTNFDERTWTMISKYQELSTNFIYEFHHSLCWHHVNEYQKLDINDMHVFAKFIRFKKLSKNKHITDNIILYR